MADEKKSLKELYKDHMGDSKFEPKEPEQLIGPPGGPGTFDIAEEKRTSLRRQVLGDMHSEDPGVRLASRLANVRLLMEGRYGEKNPEKLEAFDKMIMESYGTEVYGNMREKMGEYQKIVEQMKEENPIRTYPDERGYNAFITWGDHTDNMEVFVRRAFVQVWEASDKDQRESLDGYMENNGFINENGDFMLPRSGEAEYVPPKPDPNLPSWGETGDYDGSWNAPSDEKLKLRALTSREIPVEFEEMAKQAESMEVSNPFEAGR